MTPSLVRTMALSSEPPRIRPMERRGSISDSKFIGRMDSNAAAVFDDFDGLEDFKVAAFSTEAAEACLIKELEEGLGGTVEDGDFDIVEVNEDVVDAVGIGGGEKVLGGGEQDALLHKAGGVADASDVVAMGFDGEVVKINAAENDAGIRGSGEETKVCVYTGVETHTQGLDCAM